MYRVPAFVTGAVELARSGPDKRPSSESVHRPIPRTHGKVPTVSGIICRGTLAEEASLWAYDFPLDR